jgi:predicted lipoprotein with Yx(FWY)xxD motif
MKLILTSIALTAALVLAACGGSNNDNGGAPTAASSPSHTVSLKSINGANVLVDSRGDALYTAAQEKDGMIRCTGGCTSIWLPLTTSGRPTAASDVSGTAGVVKRPDGTRQVTLDGRPLYRFAEDGGPGKATGDGVSDSFGGQAFTWHLESAGKSTSDSSGSSGSGGNTYGY